MRKITPQQIFREASGAFGLLLIVDIFWMPGLGFQEFSGLPYLLPVLFSGLLYGMRAALGTLAGAGVLLFGLFPWISGLWFDQAPWEYLRGLWGEGSLALGGGVLLAGSLGMVGQYHRGLIRALKVRLKSYSLEQYRQRRTIQALSAVNRELEERVSKNQESLTMIYQFFQNLDTLEPRKVMAHLLEVTRIFAGARKAGLYSLDMETQKLVFEAGLDEPAWDYDRTPLALEGSIEGWVFRNRSLFSLRMLQGNRQLQLLDVRRNLITLPVILETRVWGILNLEEMDFPKYNIYTERVLQILVSLAEPALKRALDHQALSRREEVHPRTGWPYMGQLFRALEDQKALAGSQGGSFGLVVLELAQSSGAGDGQGEMTQSLVELAEGVLPLYPPRSRIYHYKEANQIGILVPGMDYDGLSLLCLESLEKAGEAALEVLVGYGAWNPAAGDVQHLLDRVDELLAIQRLL